jgi:branched-chain amino acid transport system permease protein
MTELILQALYSGLLQGGSYALIALGLALVFGTMRVINLAHGELVLLAAYIAYTVESGLGWNPAWAIPLALIIVSATSAGVYGIVSRIKKDREINSLILTFGIGVILTNMILLIWKADVRSTSSSWLQEAFVVGPICTACAARLIFFVVSLLLMVALWWWLSRSWYGRAVRAVSSNRDAAMLMGIAPGRTELVSFIVAGMLAGFAGVALYSYGVIQPALRQRADGQGLHHHGAGRRRLDPRRVLGRGAAGRRRSADSHPGQLGPAGAGRHGAVPAGALRHAERPVRRTRRRG